MDTRTLSTLLVPLFALPLLPAQEDPAEADAGGQRALQQVAPLREVDAEAWRAALAGEDHARREAEYDRLLRAALADPELQALLRSWTDEPGELGWTARLALRELDLRAQLEGRDGLGRRGPLGGSGPFGRWFGGDRLPDAFRSPFGVGPWPDAGMFRDLEDELKRMFDGRLPLQPGVGGQAQSFRLESTPGGVRIEVREETEDGEDVKTYEAETLEELYEQYPELRDKVGRLPGGASPFGALDLDRELGGLFDRFRGGLGLRSHGGPVTTDRLGILMREPGSWSASVDGVEPGVGLFVERVFPGTLAEALGIQPGDIVVTLNGRSLTSAADVRTVLEARARGDEVTAEVVGRTGARRTLTWTPPPAARPR